MKVTFWGVRGSFPVSTPTSIRYGGNTPCTEVTAGDTTLLIDAGTGIRAAGHSLLERGIADVHILLGHPHWDHIQGFPHFPLLDQGGASIAIHSLHREDRELREIFAAQQRPPFYPVQLEEARADISFVEHSEGEPFQAGEATVVCRRLNHPGVAGGFRIEHAGAAFAYICDADIYGDLLLADGLPVSSEADKEHWLEELRNRARDLGHRADLLVCDTFFLPEEYQPDWGHSRPDDAIRLGLLAEARCVGLFHHRPGREDDHMDALLERYRTQVNGEIELMATREGLEVTL
ncbi:MBL fold metallo-hydrolase [Candidatus Latescibacterota bacterium]